MRRFYKNSCLFATIFLVLLIFLDVMSMQDYWRMIFAKYTNSIDYIMGFPGTGEIKPYIEQVRHPDQTTKLIIGDSVCHQMFSGLQEYNSDFSIAGTNGAITMAGQYVLAKEYLDNHPDATDVFLLVLPQSLVRTFDTKNGYQYTVMPFVETDTINDLDNETVEIMQSVYGSFFMRPSVVDAIDRSAVNRKIYLNLLRRHTEGYIQEYEFEIADHYITKIYELCKEKNVNFYLLPCPVTEEKRDYVRGLLGDFQTSQICKINPEYMNEIYYYPADQSGDGSHFRGEYANQNEYNEKIRLMYGGMELYELIRLK